MPALSIIVVNWNVCGLLERCLRSVFARLETGEPAPVETVQGEVIVVDNGSSDGSVQMVRDLFPRAQVVANSRNRGFAAANNQAIALACGRYVLLLNPDTQVLGDSLAAMVRFADEVSDVAIVGPQLLFPDGSVQPSRYRFPSLASAFFESTWLQPYAPSRVLDRYYMRDIPSDVVHDADWVRGAALMARRAAIDEVGLLDEGYFMYSEELDWCRRMRDAGWRVVYYPHARFIHHEGKSSEQAVAARHIHFQTSKLRYFRKHQGRAVASALRLFLLASYGWQCGIEAAKWLVGHRRRLRACRLSAYGQVLASRLAERSVNPDEPGCASV